MIDLFGDGVVVMDEVDWVLHPLKSELNFPVGERVELDMTSKGERWKFPNWLLDALLFAEERLQKAEGQAHVDELPERLDATGAVELMNDLIDVIKAGMTTRALQMGTNRAPRLITVKALGEEFNVE